MLFRSLRSFSFLRPAKAILVPGMYCKTETSMMGQKTVRKTTYLFRVLEIVEQCGLVPYNTLVHIGRGVLVACHLSSLATEKSKYEFSKRTQSRRRCRSYPCKLGPTALGSPAPTLWHCLQRVLKRPAPLLASPVAKRSGLV